ncbi:MAG: hypothetical protein ACRBCT_08985 [Alphaproteobacteria bacterium]
MKTWFLGVQAAAFVWLIAGADDAHAAGGNDFSDVARNITESVAELPGMISGFSYLIGMLMGVLGILKVKDHVENPTQTPLKDGAVRMAAGGALFGLPIISEAMMNTVGTTSEVVEPAKLEKVIFHTR